MFFHHSGAVEHLGSDEELNNGLEDLDQNQADMGDQSCGGEEPMEMQKKGTYRKNFHNLRVKSMIFHRSHSNLSPRKWKISFARHGRNYAIVYYVFCYVIEI